MNTRRTTPFEREVLLELDGLHKSRGGVRAIPVSEMAGTFPEHTLPSIGAALGRLTKLGFVYEGIGGFAPSVTGRVLASWLRTQAS